MKFGIVVFPGSNCDQDMHDALHYDLKQDVRMLWHKDRDLRDFKEQDCIVLPGGFSYGDYLRCGAIARFSPMMQSVVEFANRGGKVFGVCNGFQILCESQLLPGALLRNSQQQFVCSNTFLCDSAGKVYKIPIAHGEGRYHGSKELLDQLEANNQVLFRYCEANGAISEKACPNGSSRNIAGICNAARNVMGMMPHPERACSVALGNTDGRAIITDLLINTVLQPA